MPIQNFRAFCREQMNASTDQHGNLSSTFELSVVRVGDELPDLRDYFTVEVTLDENDPSKVLLTFKREGGSDETDRASESEQEEAASGESGI